jgi:biotin carboxyl carrier protein
MEYTFVAFGKRHRVQVQKSGDGYIVSVDGERRAVRLQWMSPSRALLLTGDRRVVLHTAEDARQRILMAEGRTYRLEREGAGEEERPSPAPDSFPPGTYDLKSPMPGEVVRILGGRGDEIRRGQSLVLLEAMKMENEVQAPADGRILEVLARPGDLVEGGAPLLRFEVKKS